MRFIGALCLLLFVGCTGIKIRTENKAKNGTGSWQAPADDHSVAKQWWNESADPGFQHLNRTYVDAHKHEWLAFLPRFLWPGKTVLDYGIGAGYLGEALFKTPYSIGSYYGVDISQKALDAAGRVLTPWSSRVHLLLTPQKFAALRPQILISQQVIQHFPSVEYLNDFLVNVDESGAEELMLHFRKGALGRTVANNAYRSAAASKAFALVTSDVYLQAHLPHYTLMWKDFRPMCCGTSGEYTGWKLKTLVHSPKASSSSFDSEG